MTHPGVRVPPTLARHVTTVYSADAKFLSSQTRILRDNERGVWNDDLVINIVLGCMERNGIGLFCNAIDFIIIF